MKRLWQQTRILVAVKFALCSLICIAAMAEEVDPRIINEPCQLYSYGSYFTPLVDAKIVRSLGQIDDLLSGTFSEGSGPAFLHCGTTQRIDVTLSRREENVGRPSRPYRFASIERRKIEVAKLGNLFSVASYNEENGQLHYAHRMLLCSVEPIIFQGIDTYAGTTEVICLAPFRIEAEQEYSGEDRRNTFVISMATASKTYTIIITMNSEYIGSAVLFGKIVGVASRVFLGLEDTQIEQPV